MASSLPIQDRTQTLDRTGLRSNNPEYIILHSTRSYPEFPELLKSHQNRRFAGMGYHLFIGDSNTIYQGRPLLIEGAHTLGFNTNSIGIGFYASEEKLDKRKIDLGKIVINEMRSRYGYIPVVSHTFAQVDYINRLLARNGLTKRFNVEQDVVEPKKFEALKRDIDTFVGTLSTEQSGLIKRQMKAFKNCPGPLFNNFI